jgi:uncharacterized RDD family membrane protein YckC
MHWTSHATGETIEPENNRSGGMKYRIGMWASAGFLVAGCWAVYAFARAIPITSADPIMCTLARLSQPVVLAGFYFHVGLHFYWVLLANAATYALIGLIVEPLRHQLNHAR